MCQFGSNYKKYVAATEAAAAIQAACSDIVPRLAELGAAVDAVLLIAGFALTKLLPHALLIIVAAGKYSEFSGLLVSEAAFA